MLRVDVEAMDKPTCTVPNFASSASLHRVSFDCGSSWEVDLRADVDCNKAGLERCHPRYTLGWQHREVQLHREGMGLPLQTEYVHAYCDFWRRGRLEQVLAAPAEREAVRDRATKRLEELGARKSLAHVNVLVVMVRGMSLKESRWQLPRTVRTVARLKRSGRFRGGVFPKFAAASESGDAIIQSLLHGTAQRPLPPWAASRSLWRALERWGYVTAYGEAGCVLSLIHI